MTYLFTADQHLCNQPLQWRDAWSPGILDLSHYGPLCWYPQYGHTVIPHEGKTENNATRCLVHRQFCSRAATPIDCCCCAASDLYLMVGAKQPIDETKSSIKDDCLRRSQRHRVYQQLGSLQGSQSMAPYLGCKQLDGCQTTSIWQGLMAGLIGSGASWKQSQCIMYQLMQG